VKLVRVSWSSLSGSQRLNSLSVKIIGRWQYSAKAILSIAIALSAFCSMLLDEISVKSSFRKLLTWSLISVASLVELSAMSSIRRSF
jgi:hypothetical protein